MIKEHQPTIFDSSVRTIFSSHNDGSIAAGGGEEAKQEHIDRRKALFLSHGFPPDLPALLFVRYGEDKDYRSVSRVTRANAHGSIDADCLYTTEYNLPILLPVADCIATVVHDPVVSMLAVLHLGRHSSVAHLIEAFQAETERTLKSRPSDWRVWMSPSLQASNNTLDYFTPESPEEWSDFMTTRDDGKLLIDIPAHNRDRFERLGVPPENIQVSEIDTYTDEQYFSHRAATELKSPGRQGRMAVVAMMLGPGEPVS